MAKGEKKISALLITFNEEKNIKEVLDNIGFADEIMQPVSHGNTYQEALQNGLEVMEELILNLQATDKPLPIAKLISV